MHCDSRKINFKDTGFFSKIITDYKSSHAALDPFISFPPTLEGVRKSIEARDRFPTNRVVLVNRLKRQYENVTGSKTITENIESLLSSDTYTITTAHQNNLFTGPLYFIYKIMHAIKLAAELNENISDKKFVPVYYIGSEDADLDELNHIHLNGDKLQWNTKQTGAVGRMVIDHSLVSLIDRMQGELSVLPNGNAVITLLKDHYTVGKSVELATFHFVNDLFKEYGLVVLLPDDKALKKEMTSIFEDDLLHQSAASIVTAQAEKLEEQGYKVQANPREINLFYLKDDQRKRFIGSEGRFKVQDSAISFSMEEMMHHLNTHPEEFSPNVILRGVYQETILPNIVFIGGGGEIAYWLQLRPLFEHYKVPFPILLLRNSFLFIENKWQERIDKLNLDDDKLFQSEPAIMKHIVMTRSKNSTVLNGSLTEIENLYSSFKVQATTIDSTLAKHVDSLKNKTISRLKELEKKMFRAEKRKFNEQQNSLRSIKTHLFPKGSLQERYDNMAYYYSLWGKEWLQKIYELSPGLDSGFIIASCK